jgi:hypothetical protein
MKSIEKMHTFSNGEKHRGGRRVGAGRKRMGKGRFTVTLTEETVMKAKASEPNLSGLLDRLLASWVKRGGLSSPALNGLHINES